MSWYEESPTGRAADPVLTDKNDKEAALSSPILWPQFSAQLRKRDLGLLIDKN